MTEEMYTVVLLLGITDTVARHKNVQHTKFFEKKCASLLCMSHVGLSGRITNPFLAVFNRSTN